MAQNGELTGLVKLSTPGYLNKDAAASYERLLAAAAGKLTGTEAEAEAYRDLLEQKRLFVKNYQPSYVQYIPGHIDRRWWPEDGRYWYRKPGCVSVAVPGTSNHGWGTAVDFQNLGGFDGADYHLLATVGPPRGWNNAEGRGVGEAWHWVYVVTEDQFHAPNPTPPAPVVPDVILEDPMLKHSSFARTRAQALKADTWTTLYVTDTNKVTTAKNAEVYTVYLAATLENVQPGSPIYMRIFEVTSNADGTGVKRSTTRRIIRRIATAGANFVDGVWNYTMTLPAAGRARTVRIEVKIGGSSGVVSSLHASSDQWTDTK